MTTNPAPSQPAGRSTTRPGAGARTTAACPSRPPQASHPGRERRCLRVAPGSSLAGRGSTPLLPLVAADGCVPWLRTLPPDLLAGGGAARPGRVHTALVGTALVDVLLLDRVRVVDDLLPARIPLVEAGRVFAGPPLRVVPARVGSAPVLASVATRVLAGRVDGTAAPAPDVGVDLVRLAQPL